MIDAEIMGMVATLYGVAAAAAVLLQARQIARRRSSCDVSARFFATYAGGYGIWLLYGLSIGSLPLILVDAAGLLCGMLTLTVTLRMRGPLLRPRTWSRCPGAAPGASPRRLPREDQQIPDVDRDSLAVTAAMTVDQCQEALA